MRGVDPEEIEWRIQETWGAFLKQRNGFFEDTDGHKPYGPDPTLTKDIRAAIRKAILEYDGHLLTPLQRDEWRRDSKARAAGVGIFYDRWMTGRHTGNDVRNGGRRYLEPDRPWRQQRGKASPVERFSELYFTMRAIQEKRR